MEGPSPSHLRLTGVAHGRLPTSSRVTLQLRTYRRRAVLAAAALASAMSAASSEAQRPAGDSRPVVGVEIRRENIFDSTETGRWYARTINALHMRTRAFVVRRELLLAPGMPSDSALAAETARNLRSLGFFRVARVDTVTTDSGTLLRVTTKDRWTTKGNAGARLTGGQTLLNLALAESNLLGTGTSLGFRFRNEPDRTSLRLATVVPRALAGVVDVRAQYDRLSDGDVTSAALISPFRALGDRAAFGLDVGRTDRRILQFREGRRDPADSLRRVFDLNRFWAGRALTAGPSGYVRLETTLLLRREDFAPFEFTGALPRSRFASLGAAIEGSRARFHVTQGLRTTGVDEDVNLSLTGRAGVWLSPRQWGYDRSGVGGELAVRGGALVPGGFVAAGLEATGRFTTGLDTGTVKGSAVYVVRPAPRHLIALFAGGGLERGPYPSAEFDLGLTTGPRAFSAHSFTGNRMYQLTAEYQVQAWPDFLGLDVASLGMAAFVDHAGAWFAGSRVRRGTDAGVGFRIGSPRAPSTNGLLRIDVARRFENDVLASRWVLSVGSGFTFEIPK